MKNRKTNFIKLGILFGISLFLLNCEKEDDIIRNQSKYKTVSINEVLSYFNTKENLRNSSKSYNETYVKPNLNNIYQEKLINSSEALTIVEAKTVFSKHYSRILMLKINDEIKNVVFSMYPTNSYNKDYFSGETLITDLKGNFLSGFRVKEGIIVSKFIKTTAVYNSSKYGNKSSSNEVCEFHSANDPNCILNMQYTDEIIVTASSSNNNPAYISVTDLYGGDYTESGNNCEVSCESWEYGGGSNNNQTWAMNINLFDEVVAPKITNIVDYLKCFDLSSPATVTLYIDQPKPNKNDTWSGFPTNPDVGHTFVSITQNGITRVMGLYPEQSVNPFTNPSSQGMLANNSGDNFDVSLTINITSSQLSTIHNFIINGFSNYNLNTYNCTDFGIQMFNSIQVNITDTKGVWPGGGGSNPGNLGQDIRNMNLSSGMSRDKNGGNAMSNNGGC